MKYKEKRCHGDAVITTVIISFGYSSVQYCFHGNSCVVSGKLKPTMAFMSGKLRIKGDMTLALKLEKLMGRMYKAKL